MENAEKRKRKMFADTTSNHPVEDKHAARPAAITMNTPALQEAVAEKVQSVRQRIAHAAAKAGRDASEVRLVAVSKYSTAGDGMIEALLAAGCCDLGESRPQQLAEKAAFYSGTPACWHLIGSLQRNKVRRILPLTRLIHSLDSLKLAEAVDRIAEEENLTRPDALPPVRCLLEVDVSGDENKHGFAADELPAALEMLAGMKHLAVEGLMCMSGLDAADDETRRQFASLRRLAEDLKHRGLPESVRLGELSMGMSDDFEIAIEEGATLVRVGSLLYPSTSPI